MKYTIDTDVKQFIIEDAGKRESLPLYSKRAFEVISDVWLKTSWNQKYSYTFTWMGRPIIQHPEDLVRLQEVIYAVKPDVIIETGVAHGGSLVLSASLMKAMGHGRRVIGVDIEIRPHNRKALESHELMPYIDLIEGGSTDTEIVSRVKALIRPNESVMVILDSNHSRAHVAAELDAYWPLVTKDSYIVATDGIMRDVWDVPRGSPHWLKDNPATAAESFAAAHRNFVLESPSWRFNESDLDKNITAWPSAWLRRID